MHCNYRPPDAAPVILRFHRDRDAHAEYEVALLSYSVFTAFLPDVSL